MSRAELLVERIRFLTEYLKVLWIFLLAVGGGTAGLFLNLDSGIKALLFFGGAFVSLSTTITIIALTVEVFDLFKKLKWEVQGEPN